MVEHGGGAGGRGVGGTEAGQSAQRHRRDWSRMGNDTSTNEARMKDSKYCNTAFLDTVSSR